MRRKRGVLMMMTATTRLTRGIGFVPWFVEYQNVGPHGRSYRRKVAVPVDIPPRPVVGERFVAAVGH